MEVTNWTWNRGTWSIHLLLWPPVACNPAEQHIDSIAPVDDVASVYENQLLDGRVYFKPEVLNEVYWKLSSWSYQWNDPPCLPYATTTTLQRLTSDDAIRQRNREGDNISLLSRAASCGTLRRSRPSLQDYEDEQSKGGSFLTLTMPKIKEKYA